MTKFKAGDKAFSIALGDCIIHRVSEIKGFGISISVINPLDKDVPEYYSNEGKYLKSDKHPSLFHSALECSEYFRKVAEEEK